MVPYAGRIRNGRFTFDGVDYQMPINFAPHAIHGKGFEQPWSATPVVVGRDSSSVAMSCALDWELGGDAYQQIELTERSLTCTLAVRAADRPMPCSLGWHPWFIKPDRADLTFDRMYPRDDEYITDGRFVSPPPPPPWDDCFAGPLNTPGLSIGGVEVAISSDCEFWVVYDMPAHATCVEPQTALPDAFNLGSIGGAIRLDPGQELRRSMTISWV
jgi:aldose 1-epimerase